MFHPKGCPRSLESLDRMDDLGEYAAVTQHVMWSRRGHSDERMNLVCIVYCVWPGQGNSCGLGVTEFVFLLSRIHVLFQHVKRFRFFVYICRSTLSVLGQLLGASVACVHRTPMMYRALFMPMPRTTCAVYQSKDDKVVQYISVRKRLDRLMCCCCRCC